MMHSLSMRQMRQKPRHRVNAGQCQRRGSVLQKSIVSEAPTRLTLTLIASQIIILSQLYTPIWYSINIKILRYVNFRWLRALGDSKLFILSARARYLVSDNRARLPFQLYTSMKYVHESFLILLTLHTCLSRAGRSILRTIC